MKNEITDETSVQNTQDTILVTVAEVSPSETQENGSNSEPSQAVGMTVKERLQNALKDASFEPSMRQKTSPVSNALDEIKNQLIELKMGTADKPKCNINYIHTVVNKAGITCSVASLNTWFKANNLVTKREPKQETTTTV